MMRLWNTYQSKVVILMDQAIVSGVSFLLSMLLVRLVGIQLFGEFAIVLIISQGVVAINQSVVTSPYQSLFAQNKISNYSQKLKGIQLMIIGLLLIFLFLFQGLQSVVKVDWVQLPVVFLALFLVGSVLFDFNRKQLYLQKRYLLCLIKDAFTMGGQLVFIGVAVYTQNLNSLADILLILGGQLVLVEGVLFFFLTRPKFPTLELARTHWHFGKWMLGNSVLQWFSGNFYITIGAVILGAEVAGIIRIGQSIIGVWNVFIQALENYVPPVAALIYRENGMKSLKTYLVGLAVKGGVAISLVAVLLVLFRSIIWEVIYGVEFLDYAYILFWFGPILIFNFLGFPFRFAIRTLNKTKVLFEAYVLSSLLGFGTAHLFIHSFGLHGICLGLLLTQVVMQLWYTYRLIKLQKHENYSYRTW